MVQQIRLVRLDWQDPLTLDKVCLRNGEEDYGIYQVYGTHIIFGRNTLLYIGRAAGVNFGARFKQHLTWLEFESDVEIRLATLRKGDYEEDDNWDDWDQLVRDCEALCIYWHSPPYNSQNISTYTGQELRVRNCGMRGSLLPEISSKMNPMRPENNSF